MAVVSVAILISFHLKNQPSPLERKIALPFGIIFWFLSLACLASGTANYIKTVEKYSKRQALVQTGWKTQLVTICLPCFGSMLLTPASGLYSSRDFNCGRMCALLVDKCWSKEANPVRCSGKWLMADDS